MHCHILALVELSVSTAHSRARSHAHPSEVKTTLLVISNLDEYEKLTNELRKHIPAEKTCQLSAITIFSNGVSVIAPYTLFFLTKLDQIQTQ